MSGGREQDDEVSAAQSFIGTELGSYRLEELLGEGGMGWVYLARHTAIGRRVAIKMLRPGLANHPKAVSRFFAEAQVVNKINHENIVEIYDCVSSADEHIAYLVVEPLEGRDLDQVRRAGERLSLERTLAIMLQVARALGAAHEAGVVHRDLKPANIFLARRGEQTDFVKVLDFGIAKLKTVQSSSTAIRLTQDGTSLGTPAYLSPEQALGVEVDARTDIYSFGVILYELTTGVLPFDSQNVADMVSRHVLEQPTRPRDISAATRSIPKALDHLIMRCLAKKPEERPASMAEVGGSLEDVQRQLAEQPPVAATRRRGRGWLFAGLAVVLLAGGGAAAYTMGVLPWTGDRDVAGDAVAAAEPVPAPTEASRPPVTAEEAPSAPAEEAPSAPADQPATVSAEVAVEPPPDPAPAIAAAPAQLPPRRTATPRARSTTGARASTAPRPAPPAAPSPAPAMADPPSTPAPAPSIAEAKPAPPTRAPAPPPVRPAINRGSLDAVPSIARLSVSGLPRAEIDGAIRRATDSLRGCYRTAAKKADRTPAVTLTISFAIDEGGAARDIQVTGDTVGLAACVRAVVSKVRSRVPPDVGRASAIATVTFQPTR